MPATWLPPTTPRERAPSVTDYVGAYLKGVELSRRSQQDDTEQALANVQLQRANQANTDDAASRELTPRALGGPPKTTEISPAVPATPGRAAVPAQPGTGQSVSDFVDPADAQSFQPAQVTPAQPAQPAVAPTPGQPAVMESAHTLGSVMENVGGAKNLSTMLRTPQGRQAMQTLRVVTDDEFQKRETALRSRSMFDRKMEESRAVRAEGDELKAIDLEIAAWSSIAPAADHNGHAVGRLRDLSKERLALSRDGKQRELANTDAKAISTALTLWEDDPSPASAGGVLSAYTNAKSDQYAKHRDKFIADFQKDSARMIRQGRLSRGMGDVFNKVMVDASQARTEGRPIDFIDSTRKVLADNPDQGGAILQELMLGNPKDVSPFWMKVIFGDEGKNHNPSIVQQAYNLVLGAPSPTTGEPLEYGTPEFNQVWADKITELTRARQRPPAPPRPAGGKTPEDKEEFALREDIKRTGVELASVEATLRSATINKKDREMYKQKKARLEGQLKVSRDRLVEMGKVPPAPDAGAPNTTMPSPRPKIDAGTQKTIRETTFKVLTERHPDVARSLSGPEDTGMGAALKKMKLENPALIEELTAEVRRRMGALAPAEPTSAPAVR